nr:hypothetical protein [Micromonospora pallida]
MVPDARSFHEQLLGRCSVDGSQIFGNTNPDNPRHWLMTEGIERARPGGDLAGDWYVLKFLLDDNPVLSEAVKARYRRQYTGLYYRRNILGDWCVAEGTVYEGWNPAKHVVKTLPGITRWVSLGVDYGTTNPFAGLLLGVGVDGKLYLAREWRWDSKKQQRSLTDAEYSARLRAWLDKLGIRPDWICVDPSAASFSTQLFRTACSRPTPTTTCWTASAWWPVSSPRACSSSTSPARAGSRRSPATCGTRKPRSWVRTSRSRPGTTPWTPAGTRSRPPRCCGAPW